MIFIKIEKISENQVKFTISQADLAERDICLEELTADSEKTRRLFYEIMDQAEKEFDFKFKFDEVNSPLMIEVTQTSAETVMLIVTKIADSSSILECFSSLGLPDLPDLLNRKLAAYKNQDVKRKRRGSNTDKSQKSDSQASKAKEPIMIYSFANIDDAARASARLIHTDVVFDSTALYKQDGRYLLLLDYQKTDYQRLKKLEPILQEYGQKKPSGVLNKYSIIERGEQIIEMDALYILSHYLT